MTKRSELCKWLGLLVAVVWLSPVEAQEDDSTVEIGERHSMTSQIMDEDRDYWVYLPATYADDTYAPKSYPVLYLLDGDAHFHSASGVVQFMSTGINGNLQVPEMIVVAIPNTDRGRDLTPTETTSSFDGSEIPAMGGGGDRFLEFIREELFAEIETKYRTEPYRIFVGHSLGGLIALHALVDQPDMFQSHIAIDPSLWWDDQVLVKRAESYFSEATDLQGAVYISMANNPDPNGGPSEMKTSGEAFARAMGPASSDQFRPDIRYFEAEDHGLLHVFDGYKPSVRELMVSATAVTSHFDRVSQQFGFEMLPPEGIVNQLGSISLQQDVDKAIEYFKINIENYPSSWNAYDSLGDAYATKGETSLAIESYEKSLELNSENDNAKQRLETLRGPGD